MFEELNGYGAGYKPVQGGFMAGPEALKDGMVNCEVIHAELSKTPQSGDIVFRLRVKVISGPQEGVVKIGRAHV